MLARKHWRGQKESCGNNSEIMVGTEVLVALE